MPGSPFVSAAMMAVIVLPLAPMAHASGSINLHKTPIPTAAHIVSSKIDEPTRLGQKSARNSRTKGKQRKMPRDKYDLLGPIFAEIGSELAQIVGGNPNGAFLYAEAVDGRYSYAIFKEQHDQVRYYRGTRELGDLIWKAWETEEPDKRWAVMEYVVTGKKFDAKFLFPEQIDPEESEMERRPRALKKHFGDKRVIYPPMPQH